MCGLINNWLSRKVITIRKYLMCWIEDVIIFNASINQTSPVHGKGDWDDLDADIKQSDKSIQIMAHNATFTTRTHDRFSLSVPNAR